MINSIIVFFATIAVYKIAQKTNKIPYIKEISPILITGVIIILFLELFNIEFETYREGADFLTFLLIPATISLGFPLYKNINMLIKNKRVIYSAFAIASVIALLSTYFIGELCKSDQKIILSILPKSITAPMAIECAKQLHAIPELTTCVVVLTGIFGAIFGHKILELVHVKNNVAIGIAIGSASHVIGTSKCIEKGEPKQIVMSTIALIIVGIFTVALSPVIYALLS